MSHTTRPHGSPHGWSSRRARIVPWPTGFTAPAKALTGLGAVCLLTVALLGGGLTVSAESYSVDGMIGQVNGRAIYANAVLNEQLRETLARWGREMPRDTFRKRAAERIALRLNGMVTDALVYGEAQRDLSDQERQGLTVAVSRQREQLLREYGQGSPALAEAKLTEETGLNLEQTLDDWRKWAIIDRYTKQKIRPKINVTRKDIKRYYAEHYDEFNPPATRTVRVIHAGSKDDAQYIRSLLDSGKTFAQAAADERNLFRRDSGGMMGPMAGDKLFANEEINRITLGLEPGQCAGPITVGDKDWFVCVEKIEQEPARSLMDVQTQIHMTLYQQQFREQSERYRQRLFEKGSYNSIEQMTMSLLEIAMDRYAKADR
jgi:PPIC-type PPIASE domain